MTLKEIIEKCSRLGVHERRCITDKYGELVFYNREMDEWNETLASILGPAIKPAGMEPTEDDLDLTRDYGGIWIDQTLFGKDFHGVTIIAMFWPWQDAIHTTLKMALLEK